MITIHMIVRNEDRFVKASLLSALSSNEVKEALVWDTGSTDRTVNKILSIKDPRIKFCQKDKVDRKELVYLRNQQIELTKTLWILIVDGDEIWPEKNLNKLISVIKQCNSQTIALVNKTRNVIDDIYHYLPESEGHYQIGSWKGHLNIRAIRNLPGLTVRGVYPNEWYELNGNKIQDQANRLKFVNTWYLHVTHLKRSNNWLSEIKTIDRIKKCKLFYKLRGKEIMRLKEKELPGILKA